MNLKELIQKVKKVSLKQKKDINEIYLRQIDFNNLIVYTFLGMIFTLSASFFVYFLVEIIRMISVLYPQIYLNFLVFGLISSAFICLLISYYMGYSFYKVRQEQKRSRSMLKNTDENLKNLKD